MTAGGGAMPITFETVSLRANLLSSSGDTHVLRYEEPRPATLSVDGFACTGVVTNEFWTKGPPTGKSCFIQASGTCGADDLVEIYVSGDDDTAYPQTCADVPHIQMSVGGEGDAGYLAYDTSKAVSCTIPSGPSVADETTRVVLQRMVGSAATHVHTFAYAAAAAVAP
jgi:hypothetical protein